MKNLVRNIVIGKSTYIESWVEYRQVILSGQYALIAILIFALYWLWDMSGGYFYSTPVYVLGIVAAIASIQYHRDGNHCTANSILFPAIVIVIHLITASESLSNGGYVMYLPVVIGAFAVFDYKHRKKSLMVAGLASLCFLSNYLFGVSVVPHRYYNEELIEVNRLINFSTAMPATIMAVFLMLRLGHHNARKLFHGNQLLKKTNQDLDHFIYSTSHDLRAPLNSIEGLITLSERSTNLLEVQRYLGLMKDRVKSLNNFIVEITDYARNSQSALVKSDISLYPLVREIWDSLKFCRQADGIDFIIDFDNNLKVNSDPSRLRIILSNLISNAIRYHDKSKSNPFIKVGYKKTDRSFSLTVEDNGLGIAPEFHQKIFDMFFKAHNNASGSGLGLYIVGETIKKLSGQVQLESAPLNGSRFEINIPN
jgi:signal transduction histidine kinase